MGVTWISWRTITTVIITILQIPAVIGVRTTVTGVEGQRFDFRCDYQDGRQSNAKHFLRADGDVSSTPLIWTDKHNQWVKNGRFSLYDNITGAFFIVRVNELTSEDSGTYWCGVDVSSHLYNISVIQLNVNRANSSESHPRYITSSPIFRKDLRVDKLNLPLYLTAVMCVIAILIVCLFTLCLLLAIKHRRSVPRLNRETSSDYETMRSGARTEPELCCSCSDPGRAGRSALPPPPPNPCSHFTPRHRESTVTLGLGEYVDVDVPGHGQYQHLDLSQLEEHIYYSLNGNSGPKDEHLGVKEQINC